MTPTAAVGGILTHIVLGKGNDDPGPVDPEQGDVQDPQEAAGLHRELVLREIVGRVRGAPVPMMALIATCGSCGGGGALVTCGACGVLTQPPTTAAKHPIMMIRSPIRALPPRE